MELPVLSAEEQRVLGSLLEKEVTVPASYPMTVNSIRVACNQTSSREPVVDYDERAVHDVLRELKGCDLVAVTWADSGRRTLKYVQTIAERLGWAPDERALLTVLMLRGAQPPGALKTRTERLHPFADRADVETTLARMAAAEPPLVQELPKQPREQDHRWVHLLGPVDIAAASPPASAAPAIDREAPLAAGAQARDRRVVATYDAVAATYAEQLLSELDQMPFERWLLDRVVSGASHVVEVGCGPGHVTAYVAATGTDTLGLDLTPAMIEQARTNFPDGRYEVGDLRRLMRPADAEGWDAVLAWYSLIHLTPSELPEVLDALVRPLAPGGRLVIAAHAGRDVLSATEWFEQPVEIDVVEYEPAELVALLQAAGLVDVEWYLRGPIRTRDETTDRVYVIGRRPR